MSGGTKESGGKSGKDSSWKILYVVDSLMRRILERHTTVAGLFIVNIPLNDISHLCSELVSLTSKKERADNFLKLKTRIAQEQNGVLLGGCLLQLLREYSLIPSQYFQAVVDLEFPDANTNEDMFVAAVCSVLYSISRDQWKELRLVCSLLVSVANSNNSANGSISLSHYVDIFAPLLSRPKHSSFLDAEHVKGVKNLRKILMACISYGDVIFADVASNRKAAMDTHQTSTTTKSPSLISLSVENASSSGQNHGTAESGIRKIVPSLMISPLNLKMPPSSPSCSSQPAASPRIQVPVLLANRSTGDLNGVFSVMEDTVSRFFHATSHVQDKGSNVDVFGLEHSLSYTVAEKQKSVKPSVIHGGCDWLEAGIISQATRKRAVHACRALRVQIRNFEDRFQLLHGHLPKGNSRSPIGSTYSQYKEWKRHIRDFAAVQIQSVYRGYRARQQFASSMLSTNISPSNISPQRSKTNHGAQAIFSPSPQSLATSSSVITNSPPIVPSREENRKTSTYILENTPPTSSTLASSPPPPVVVLSQQQRPLRSSGSDNIITNPTNNDPLANVSTHESGNNSSSKNSDDNSHLIKIHDSESNKPSNDTSNESSSQSMKAPSPEKMTRHLSSQEIQDDSAATAKTIEGLQSEKKRIKGLLKKFDADFLTTNGRMPSKSEKEPIRNLYEEYHHVKTLLRSFNGTMDEMDEETSSKAMGGTSLTHSPIKGSSSRNGQKRNERHGAHRIEDEETVTASAAGGQPVISNSNHSISSTQELHSSNINNCATNNDASHSTIESLPSHIDSRGTGGGYPTLRMNKMVDDNSWTSFSKDKSISELQAEKRLLHDMLKRYEREFEQAHGRPVQTVQDIAPVQEDYDRYKLLKMKLEDAKEK